MHIETRNLLMTDYESLKESMQMAYDKWQTAYWKESHIHKLLEIFPEGQLCVTVDGKVAGCALSIIVNYDEFGDEHTYKEITGNYTFDTHYRKGDTLYGIEVFVNPEYRNMRVGRRLYDARKALCENLNLKNIVAGGRIPIFSKYSNELTPKEYITKVKNKEIYDPTLTFQLANDFHVVKVMKDYMPGDNESKEFATLIEWNNIYYEPHKNSLRNRKQTVRIGLVQWEMRLYNNIREFLDYVEFYVDVVSGYKSDFILFPELFNAPLMAEFNDLTEVQSIRELAKYSAPIKDKCQELAISYNVNIITGSMPCIEEDRLHNVGFLCRRNGSSDRYEKIHITPNEKDYWGMVGGNKLKVFETDCAKIGILICYDVEFPELSRLLAEEGMEILFVPFLTDTQNAYTRVKNCAMARAIENECFVAIAGSNGNLPKVKNMDIQYAQSAVYTPGDFQFPINGIKAETTTNNETVLIVDINLDLLKELHSHGSVTNLKSRRKDIYEIIRHDIKNASNT
jgi:predicted amidohydrolase/ribosomal protein S18 acetylase RimI-like enzyme